MPKSWFFEIHEDTQEQESANMMEHSAAVLDISSDDDLETKQMNEDRGKENVPPPEFMPAQSGAQQQIDGAMAAAEQHVKLPKLRKIAQDAMDEDRKPLGDLPATEFYAEGCDASTYVTVDAGMEKPSKLKQFETNCSTPEKKKKANALETVVAADAAEVATTAKEEVIQIYSDETALDENAPQKEVALEVANPSEPQPLPAETS